jgi:hypothetical protein
VQTQRSSFCLLASKNSIHRVLKYGREEKSVPSVQGASLYRQPYASDESGTLDRKHSASRCGAEPVSVNLGSCKGHCEQGSQCRKMQQNRSFPSINRRWNILKCTHTNQGCVSGDGPRAGGAGVQVKEVRVGMVAGFDFNSHVSVFRSCRAQERGEHGRGGGGLGIGILYIEEAPVSIDSFQAHSRYY